MSTPGSSNGECENLGSNPSPGTNTALLAREAAAELGALDPRPEPPVSFSGPTRLERWVFEGEEGEVWFDPVTGIASRVGDDGIERHL